MSITSRQLFSNNAVSTLAVELGAADTAITVSGGQGVLFPSPSGGDFFMVTLENFAAKEICKCTSRIGDVLTVVRAQEGTTAGSFPIGASVQLRVTKLALDKIQTADEKQVSVDLLSSLPQATEAKVSSVIFSSDFDDGGMPLEALKSGVLWKFPSHPHAVVSGEVGSATTISITTPSAFSTLTYQGGKYLVQMTSGVLAGYARRVSSISDNTISWVEDLPYPPSPGDTFSVYVSLTSRLKDLDNRNNFLIKGDFGLGTDAVTITDTNAHTVDGFWTGSSLANAPTSATLVGWTVARAAGATLAQYCTDTAGTSWSRSRVASVWGSWKQILTSSDIIKQTSTSDTTAGSALIVGGFGVGGSALTSTDFDAITATGSYQGTDAVGTPVAAVAVSVLHLNRDSTSAVQYASRVSSDNIWFRRKSAGTWSSWVSIYHSGNQFALGTSDTSARTALGLGSAALDTSDTTAVANTVVKRGASGGIAVKGIEGSTLNLTPTAGYGLIEICTKPGTAGTPYIDFNSGATAVDYDSRIMASGGTGTTGQGSLDVYSGNLNLRATTGAVTLHYGGVKKLETSSTGAYVTGTLMANGVSIDSAGVLHTGTGGLSAFYHSGTLAMWHNTVGSTYVRTTAASTQIYLQAADSGGLLRNCGVFGSSSGGASATLCYNDSARLLTTSAGVDVTGNLNVSGIVYEADSGWLTPSFVNGWFQNNSSTWPVRYRKIGRTVWLRGVLQSSGTNSTTAFTLPSGYRPSISSIFRTVGGAFLTGSGSVQVLTTGVVSCTDAGNGSTLLVGLDGVVFTID